MPTATANGQKFTFPEGTTPEQMGQAIDEFFGSVQRGAQNNIDVSQDPRFKDIPDSIGGRIGESIRSAQENKLADTLRFEQLPAETQELINSLSPSDAFLVGIGRGFENIGKGVGLVEPDFGSDTAIDNLKLRRGTSVGAGEVVGETAPFIAPATAIGRIPSLTGRAIASTGLAGAEGGIITKGRGGNANDILSNAGLAAAAGGALEVGLPVVGRIAGTLFRRIQGKPPVGSLINADGTPSQELAQALEEVNIGFDDVVEEARKTIQKPDVNPQQAARSALFTDLNAPTLRGDITQNFTDQAIDQRLVGSSADPVSDSARIIRLDQSQAFTDRLEEQIKATGVPDDVGDSIKEALTSRRDILRSEKNRLYKEAAEQAENIGELPVITNQIEEAIPDARTVRRISRLQGSQVDALDDLLVEFRIVKDQARVERFIKSGGELEQLSLKNIEEFRSALNQIERADTTNAINVLTGPIKRALDDEADNILKFVENTGQGNAIETFKQARTVTKQLKQEFSPQSITGRLMDVKRDGITPVVESSKVYKDLINKEPEFLDRTINSLRNAGAKGTKAIGDLQASVVFDLIDHAFKANTRKVQGVKTFGAVAFNNRLKKIGNDRLEKIFSTRPKVLQEIRKVAKAAELTTPDNRAVPKGSADVILDRVIPIIEKIPGTHRISGGLRIMAETGKNKADLQRTLNSKPEVKRAVNVIQQRFPSLAIALGVPSALEEDE